MFPTGSKLLLGATVARRSSRRRLRLQRQGGSLGTIGLIFAAVALGVPRRRSTSTPATPTCRRWTRRRATESAAARPAPADSMWPIVGALGGVLVVVGLVTYPVVFIFGIIALLGRHRRVDGLRRGASERRPTASYNAGSASGIAHPLEFPCSAPLGVGIVVYSFSRIMLFAVEDRAARSRSGSSPRWSSRRLRRRLPAVDPQRRRRRRSPRSPRSGSSPAAPSPRSAGERESSRTRPPRRSPPTASATPPTRPRPTSTPRRPSPPRPTSWPRSSLREDGTLWPRRWASPASSRPAHRHPLNPTNVRFRNETDEHRRLVLDLGTRPGSTRRPATRSRTRWCRTRLHAARRRRRQPVHDVPDHRSPSCGRRRARTRSSCPASTGQHRGDRSVSERSSSDIEPIATPEPSQG